ncbi:hypothetical protein BH11BAC6_BH11BAC6_01710 [soil metagenome]
MQKFVSNIFLPVLFSVVSFTAFAQPGTTVELDKPKPYEKRTLASEKSDRKKFKYPRRLYQNTITHYNYYFNAENTLKIIVEEAKKSNQEDYTQLLPFYSYSLDNTAGSGELDSVIYKCNAGILLHDLRNDWIDNLYLLLGQAYFYRKNFDSANAVFRYINYAWAPKEDGGYDIPVGSNLSNPEGVFSVATKEKNALPEKVFATPPSRNDALLWEARNDIEAGNLGMASGIIEILQTDPLFPKRLQPQLQELTAYYQYSHGSYDSAAAHLAKALDAADTKLDRARMEFLIAQLYGRMDSTDKAVAWYSKSAEHTTDPIMEVYANLNSIKAAGGSDEKVLQEKLDNLMKMAKRDKYFSYRDIIYYALAQVDLELKNDSSAAQMLNKSIYYNAPENPEQRSKSFLLLADINYNRSKYIAANNFYDSVTETLTLTEAENARLDLRKPALEIIAGDMTVINREDSLQALAAMPKEKRDAIIKKALRALRKQQGLAEEPELSTNPAVQQVAPQDLFGIKAATKDWYFNNLQLKSTGANQFRANWGTRPNADNWRRQAAIKLQADADADAENDEDSTAANTAIIDGEPSITDANGEITFESLSANLPLSEEQLKSSNDKIADAMFMTGQTFQDKLEDYPVAIKIYVSLLEKFPDTKDKEEAIFNLYYCYTKTGDKVAADAVLNTLTRNFPNGTFTAKLINKPKNTKENDPATVKYKSIYDLFIAGNFEKAEAEKTIADSTYGNSYWTPQLLYIEAVYYVSKKEDSTAITKLDNLQTLYPQTPLAEKATTMIDVLKRRSEIEGYLTKLEITRYEEGSAPVIDLNPIKPTVKQIEIKKDSLVAKPVTQVAKNNIDTTSKAATVIRSYTFDAKEPQYVVILLDKVAPVFVNEVKNAINKYNQITFYNQKLTVTPAPIDERYNLVLVGPFTDATVAVEYADKVRPATAGRILPWLTADKWSYTIISQSNLDIMKETKDIDSYKKLLEKILPGKF